MTTVNKKTASFADLGVSPKLLQILANLKFSQPTPIQEQCIPVALSGKDIVGIAQTGTGKTLAFALPLIQLLADKQGQALILLPTRELALQVDEVFQQIGKTIGLRTASIIGGASAYDQKMKIRANPHVIISTPGRLINHLNEKNLSLQNVKIVVLDEADRMLDIGFLPDIKRILNSTPRERQTFMFSATMPRSIGDLAATYQKLPLRIEVAPAGTAAKNVEQELFIVPKEAKMRLLDKLLTDTPGTVLIFSRTKFGAKKITANLNAMGFPAAEIHSNRSMVQRIEAMKGFKAGRYRILVATDIASRGIDVNNISLVINYDLPENSEDYIHRIGRTGRADNYGKAISFAQPQERKSVREIERLIRKVLPIMALPELPPQRANIRVAEDRPSFGNRGPRQFGRGPRQFPAHGGRSSRPFQAKPNRFAPRAKQSEEFMPLYNTSSDKKFNSAVPRTPAARQDSHWQSKPRKFVPRHLRHNKSGRQFNRNRY